MQIFHRVNSPNAYLAFTREGKVDVLTKTASAIYKLLFKRGAQGMLIMDETGLNLTNTISYWTKG